MGTKKILALFPVVLLAGATALAYSHGGVAAGMSAVTRATGAPEPVILLLSGTVLLAIAGALRGRSI